jgi:hypothetical protein
LGFKKMAVEFHTIAEGWLAGRTAAGEKSSDRIKAMVIRGAYYHGALRKMKSGE